jgi:hypothetical protein
MDSILVFQYSMFLILNFSYFKLYYYMDSELFFQYYFFAFSVRVFVVEFISPSPLPVLPPLLATTNRRRLLLSYLVS